MSTLNVPLMHTILRECAAAEPDPWHPKQTTHDWEELKPGLERLWQDGYVERLHTNHPDGMAFGISDAGFRLLKQPETWERYRDRIEQELTDPRIERRRQVIRNSISEPSKPIFSRWVLWLNVIIFGYGLYLCSEKKVKYADFAFPAIRGKVRVVQPVLLSSGALTPSDVRNEKWVRLLTCCFVHVGLLHLLMNTYALIILGREVEHVWGSWRFLPIFLVSGIGGSCLGIYLQPEAGLHAGASGGLCGLLSAIAVWLITNRRYLPRHVFARHLMNLLAVGLIIALLSFVELNGVRIGWAAHLGGAIAGAVTALLLHWQRFGRPRVLQIAAFLIALSLPVGFVAALYKEMPPKPGKENSSDGRRIIVKRVPSNVAEWQRLLVVAGVLEKELQAFYKDQLLLPLLRVSPDKRDLQKARAVQESIEKRVGAIDLLLRSLSNLADLQHPQRIKWRDGLIQRYNGWRKLFVEVQDRLRMNKAWTRDDEDHFEDWTKIDPDAR